MKQIKKALALLLSAVLLMGLLPAAALAAEDDPLTMLDFVMAIYVKFGLAGQTSSEEAPFTDLDGLTDEQINALGVFKDNGLLPPDPEDGSSHHGDPTLRFIPIVWMWVLSGMPQAGEDVALPYKDVLKDIEEGATFGPAFLTFYEMGVLTDEDMDKDGNFRPWDELTAAQLEAWFSALDKWAEDNPPPVTRLMIATLIYSSPMFGLSGKTSSDKEPFSDLDGLTDEQIMALAVLKDEGLLSGNPDNTVKPFDPVNRISAAILLWRAADSPKSEDVTLPYKDIPEEPAAYKEALCGLYAHGVLTEEHMDEDGNFRPDDILTFPEMGDWMGRMGACLEGSEEVDPQGLAEELHSLNLLKGMDDTGTNFDLDRAAKRVEGLVMLIRLLGKEEEAEAGSWSHPFIDVVDWADSYVGYSYENSITNGVSSTKYDCKSNIKVYMYLTYVLRALGYSDKDGKDFVWDDPYDLATEAGILPPVVDREQFLREDMVLISVAALNATLKDSDQTLADKLIEDGVFTQEDYDAAEMIHRAHDEWAA